MSTYLVLVNNVLDRLNEVNLDASTFASARGIHAAAKLGVKNAVMRINSQKWEWPFNYATTTNNLTVGENIYGFESDNKIPDWESFYLVAGTYGDKTINTQRLAPIQRQEWYKWHRETDLDNVTDGREAPVKVFWNSNASFGVTPCPDEEYTLTYNYWAMTTDLSADSDPITIPENFNWVIEQGALEDMYMFLDNDQRAALGSGTFKDAINTMARILIPQDIGNTMRSTVVNFGNEPFFNFGRTSNPML